MLGKECLLGVQSDRRRWQSTTTGQLCTLDCGGQEQLTKMYGEGVMASTVEQFPKLTFKTPGIIIVGKVVE